MKKLISLACALMLLLCLVPVASAEDGNVHYTGDVGEFVFQPGGANSLTDLFPDFKDVMPGDVLTMGNVDPAGQLRLGTPESVRNATLELLEKCCGYPNFVISSGCDIPPATPWENIEAFFDAVKEFYDGKN